MEDAQINMLSEIVMRQTDYDSDTAKQKVTEFNGDIEGIVREFMNPPPKKEQKKSINQKIYGQIRGLMDDAAKNFRNQQELNKVREKYMAQLQQQHQQQQQNVVLENISENQTQ